MVSSPAKQPTGEPLSNREREILHLLEEGLSNKEIGQRLVLSLETVKWYNKQLYSKLGVRSRTQAVARAKELRLLVEPAVIAPAESAVIPRHNLPVRISSFVGREHEKREVKRLLAESRLLTLTGPGGTGKTRLAHQVATELLSEFRDGVYFVDLVPVFRPDLVATALAKALALRDAAGKPIIETLKQFLATRNLLLLLDNFEHVITAAPLLSELLSIAPGLKVLVTSREALMLYGEQEYEVPPLKLPDPEKAETLPALLGNEAVALFVQRARSVRHDFQLSPDDARSVVEICIRLDGLPLAIELAAARVKLFTPQGLLDRLENRLNTLSGSLRDVPVRQQTLRGAIDWSFDLLTEEEQLLFARISVFQGGRSVEACEAVCGHGLVLDVVSGLESLHNKSLIKREDGLEGVARFVMLETIHGYACYQLEKLGEMETMRQRHAAYFAAMAERAEPYLRGGSQQMRWLRLLEQEHDNLQAALEWSLQGGDIELGLRMTGALGYFWYRQSHYGEGRRSTDRALQLCGSASPAVQARVYKAAGIVAFYLHDPDRGRQLDSQALKLFRELGETRETGWSLIRLSSHAILQPERFLEARSLCQEGLALLRQIGDDAGIAQGLNLLGELERLHGDLSKARAAYRESLEVGRKIGDKLREAMQFLNFGFVAQQERDIDDALASFKRGLALAMEIEYEPLVTSSLGGLAGAAAAMGHFRRAARLIGAAEALFDAQGWLPQPGDQQEFERGKETTSKEMAKTLFEATIAEGRAMSLIEAVAYALSENDGSP